MADLSNRLIPSTSSRGPAGSINGPSATSVSRRDTARPIPEYTSAEEGMEGVRAAFASFANMGMNALGELQAAKTQTDAAAIKRENEQMELEGKARGLQATPEPGESPEDFQARELATLSPEQRTSRRYVDAMTGFMGQRYGAQLAGQFRKELQALPIDQDAEAFTRSFVEKNLKNGSRLGTGNPLFDTEVMSTFESMTLRERQSRGEDQVKAFQVQQEQTAVAAAAEAFPTMEASDLPALLDRFKAAMPGAPEQAPLRMTQALLAAVDSSPEKGSKLLSMLESPGSFTSDVSFAKQYPQVFDEISQKVTTAVYNRKTIRGVEEGRKIEQTVDSVLTNPEVPTPEKVRMLADVMSPGGALDVLREQEGEGWGYEGYRTKFQAAYDKLKEETILLNNVEASARGLRPFDVSEVKKALPLLFKQSGVDLLRDPEKAAVIISRTGNIVDDTVKATVSAGFTQFSDGSPERFKSSLRFMQAMEAASGTDVAETMLSEPAALAYRHVRRELLTGKSPEVIVEGMSKLRTNFKAIRDTNIRELLGSSDTEGEARAELLEEILDSLHDASGNDDIILDPAMANEMIDMVKTQVLGRGADWQAAAADVGQIMAKSPRVSLSALQNGTYRLERSTLPAQVPVMGDDGQPTGEFTASVPLSRAVPTPATGGTFDTVQQWEDAKTGLVDVFADKSVRIGGATFKIDDTDALSLDAHSAYAGAGISVVMNRDAPLMIPFGTSLRGTAKADTTVPSGFDTMTLSPGQDLTIPADPAEAMKMAAEGRLDPFAGMGDGSMGKLFKLIPYPPENPRAFIVGYQPALPAVPSLDELAAKRDAAGPPKPEGGSLAAMRMQKADVFGTRRAQALPAPAETGPVPEGNAASLKSIFDNALAGASKFVTSSFQDIFSETLAGKPTKPILALTEEEFDREMFDYLLENRRAQGRVPPSIGVTAVSGRGGIRNTVDIMDRLATWTKQQKEAKGGFALDKNATPTSESYRERRYQFMAEAEAVRTRAYDDATGRSVVRGGDVKGNVTVGIGFNMERPDARDVFQQALGLSSDAFDKVKSGQRRLTPVEVKKLFDWNIVEAESLVHNKFRDVDLTEHQRLALVSLAFNSPKLIGPRLTELVRAKKWTEARDEILHQSNAKRDKGIARRRFGEAVMFEGASNLTSSNFPAFTAYMEKYS